MTKPSTPRTSSLKPSRSGGASSGHDLAPELRPEPRDEVDAAHRRPRLAERRDRHDEVPPAAGARGVELEVGVRRGPEREDPALRGAHTGNGNVLGDGVREPRRHRPARLAHLPRHDELRRRTRSGRGRSTRRRPSRSSGAPSRAGSRSSTPPTSTTAAQSEVVTGRAAHEALRHARGVRRRDEGARPDDARARTAAASRASTSSPRSTRRSSGSASTTSTSTRSTAGTR